MRPTTPKSIAADGMVRCIDCTAFKTIKRRIAQDFPNVKWRSLAVCMNADCPDLNRALAKTTWRRCEWFRAKPGKVKVYS